MFKVETDKGIRDIVFEVKAYTEKQALFIGNRDIVFPNMNRLKESGKIKWFKTINKQIIKDDFKVLYSKPYLKEYIDRLIPYYSIPSIINELDTIKIIGLQDPQYMDNVVSDLIDLAKHGDEYKYNRINDNNIDTILILGDTFDRRKYINFFTYKRTREMFFDRLFALNIKVYMLAGNHDT